MGQGYSQRSGQDASIVLCGRAGQGIQTVELLLKGILKRAGYNLFATKEYMSRIRGGANSTEIRVSSDAVRAFVRRMDILVVLDRRALDHLANRITRDTLILAEKDELGDEFARWGDRIFDIPFNRTAVDIGDKIYSNTVAAGAIAGLFAIPLQTLTDYITHFFSSKAPHIIESNVHAAVSGHTLGTDLSASGKFVFNIAMDSVNGNHILVNGAEAVGLGAAAGGCNFISSYPMSPSTGVLTFLAQHSSEFDMIVEQAEDEIAAVNMALGASYAGARAMVTTSGGGFSLMAEGLSLAGMIETPIVVHLAQRPGPATGLPTRTEQGDLELALHAGHGEFPRAIFAPGTLEEVFYLTQNAFNIAERYQSPVIILTDQYLMDSYYNVRPFQLSGLLVESHRVETNADYKRYELTQAGISPRGLPGFGSGLVVVDSDEHDEEGHITEDLGLRVKMVEKRLKKLDAIKAEAIRPTLIGSENYRNLIICWGSTFNVVSEALSQLSWGDTAMLHFSQVYPLHSCTADFLNRAEKHILIEGNATGQFGKLIKLSTGVDIENRILKYNGLCFSVEEVVERLNGYLDMRFHSEQISLRYARG
ncbi:MAG: 2-oxoacid:acceptor oxidoreductase subunit alpha [Planctomycetota bacterium]|jgi:2-oxoglutarate ferredoxin oxidoreductase subunit alpha